MMTNPATPQAGNAATNMATGAPEPSGQPELALGMELLERLMDGHTLGHMLGYSEESREALYAVGHNLYGQGRYDDAMHMFGFLMMYDHLDTRFYKAYAACLQMAGRREDALRYYAIASLLDLTDPEPAFQSAQCFLALGRRGEARESLEYAKSMAAGEKQHAQLFERVSLLLDLLDKHQGAPSDSAEPADAKE